MKDRETTTRSRELGAELRRVRERAGYNGKEIAHKLGWSVSKVSRLESGRRGASKTDVTTYLVLCGVVGDDLTHLLDIMQDVWSSDWLNPSGLGTLVAHERTAWLINQYEPLVIPGLLQTEGYARALFHAAGLVPEDTIETRVWTRMERQDLLRREREVQLIFFVAEQVLRSPIGGLRVMNEQLLHLALISVRPWCIVRVVPQSFPLALLGGAFQLMEYRDHRPVVYVESQTHSIFLENNVDIEVFRAILDRLNEVTLDQGQSRELFATLANEYDVLEEDERACAKSSFSGGMNGDCVEIASAETVRARL